MLTGRDRKAQTPAQTTTDAGETFFSPPRESRCMVEPCGQVVVRPDFDPSALTSSCNIGTPEIGVGQSVEAEFSITNNNDADAAVAVPVLVDGDQVDLISHTVGGNTTSSFSTTIAFDSEGTFNVTLGSLDAQRA